MDDCPHAYKFRRDSRAPPPGSAESCRRSHVPRGPLTDALLDALAREPHRLRRHSTRRSRPIRWPTRTSSSRSTSATSCTTAGCPAWPTSGSGSRRCSRCAGAWRRASRPALIEAIGAPGPPGPARGDGHRAARDRGRRRGAVALQAPRARGHARAAARVRRAPLGLPAQGGRPALVGAAAPQRAAEGRDGRDPGRRVRRRPGRAHPRRRCSPRRWPGSGSTRPTAPTST